MILNISPVEASKVKKGDSFYTIKQILKSKFSESKLNTNLLTRKDSEVSFEILSYNVFNDIHEALNNIDYRLFNVGDNKEEVFKYYRSLNGKRSSKKWITIVFELKEI